MRKLGVRGLEAIGQSKGISERETDRETKADRETESRFLAASVKNV